MNALARRMQSPFALWESGRRSGSPSWTTHRGTLPLSAGRPVSCFVSNRGSSRASGRWGRKGPVWHTHGVVWSNLYSVPQGFLMWSILCRNASNVIGVVHFLCYTYWTQSLRKQEAKAREDEEGKAVHLRMRYAGRLKACLEIATLPPIHLSPCQDPTLLGDGVFCLLRKCSLSTPRLTGFDSNTQSRNHSLKWSAAEPYLGHSKRIFVCVRSYIIFFLCVCLSGWD